MFAGKNLARWEQGKDRQSLLSNFGTASRLAPCCLLPGETKAIVWVSNGKVADNLSKAGSEVARAIIIPGNVIETNEHAGDLNEW